MKNRANGNDVWKDEMIRRWNNLMLCYQKLQEHPTAKLLGVIVLGLLRILFRILVRKIFEFFLDES